MHLCKDQNIYFHIDLDLLELLHQWMIDVLKTTSKSYPELRRCDQFDAFLRASIATERSAIIQTFLQHFATVHGIQFNKILIILQNCIKQDGLLQRLR